MISEIIGINEINLIVNLILSLVAGFSISAERESRGKDAGISTHTLVIKEQCPEARLTYKNPS